MIYIPTVLHFVLEINCGDYPTVGNSTVLNEGDGLSDETNYTCLPYHRFSDGYTIKTINCTIYAMWSAVEHSCCCMCPFNI